MAVAALLDAAVADDAVVEALAAKGKPGAPEAASRGGSLGRAKSILRFLDARGIAVNSSQREEILRCDDLDRLDLWARRAAVASSAEEVFAE